MLSFAIDLPTDPLFCPKLQCDVFDYVFKGFSQPLIGTFTIEIGNMMQQQKEDKDTQLSEGERIIKALNEYINEERDLILPQPTGLMIASGPPMAQQRTGRFGKDDFGLLDGQEEIKDSSIAVDTDAQEGKGLLVKTPLREPSRGKQTTPEDIKRSDDKSADVSGKSRMDTSGIDLALEAQKSLSKKSKGKISKKKTTKGGKTGFLEDSSPKMDITSGINNMLMKKKNDEKLAKKESLNLQRQLDEAALADKGEKTHKNIIMPKYKFSERLKVDLEEEGPPASLYMPIGYDKSSEDGIKHYRRYYQDELENNKEIFPQMPFHCCDVMRGQSRGNKKSFFGSLFGKREETDDSGQVSTIKEVGQFKGRVSIANKADEEEFKQKLQQNNKVIVELLENLHHKVFDGKSLNFKLEKLESFEGKKKFSTKLKSMGLGNERILEYMQ